MATGKPEAQVFRPQQIKSMFRRAKLDRQSNLGEWGESYVGKLYEAKGYKILDKNFYNSRGRRVGEIDLIALKDRQLVFIEVKTRVSAAFGRPAEAVDFFKQQKLLKACKLFIHMYPEFNEYQQRIDVVELIAEVDKTVTFVNIIENAIEDTR